MKLARRYLLTAAVALAAATALVACGGDDDNGGSPSAEGNEDLFTTAGFQQAVDAVEGEAGTDAPILRVQITAGGAEFQIREDEQASGFVYTGGSLEDLEVDVIGPGSLEGTDFPLSQVDPAAIDKIVEGVRAESGIDDIEVTVMTLEKSASDDKLKWTINAEGGGRAGLVFTADPDGSNVTSPLGAAGDAAAQGDEQLVDPKDVQKDVEEIPKPSADQQARIQECVEQAQGNPEELAACGAILQQ